MSEEAPDVIMCKLVSQGGTNVAGAKVEQCKDCRQDIWIAPSSRIIHPTLDACCFPCCIKRAVAAGEPIEHMPINQMQVQELLDVEKRSMQARNN